jgi:hypothetical protein
LTPHLLYALTADGQSVLGANRYDLIWLATNSVRQNPHGLTDALGYIFV